MAERVIDATRQGVPATYRPDEAPVPNAEPVSVEQARAAVAGWRESGMPLWGLHQVAIALDAGVTRLEAALPLLVGCAAGKGLACTLDAHGWHSCCLALRKARELGLAPPVERRDCEDPA